MRNVVGCMAMTEMEVPSLIASVCTGGWTKICRVPQISRMDGRCGSAALIAAHRVWLLSTLRPSRDLNGATRQLRASCIMWFFQKMETVFTLPGANIFTRKTAANPDRRGSRERRVCSLRAVHESTLWQSRIACFQMVEGKSRVLKGPEPELKDLGPKAGPNGPFIILQLYSAQKPLRRPRAESPVHVSDNSLLYLAGIWRAFHTLVTFFRAPTLYNSPPESATVPYLRSYYFHFFGANICCPL